MHERFRLGEVCTVTVGQSPKGSYYNNKAEGLPFYQGKKEFCDRYIRPPQMWTRKTTKIAFAGDILMSVRAPVGPVNVATQKICIGRGLASIRPRENIDTSFLFYQLLALQDSIAGNEGAVFPSINKSQIELISLWCPPLPEQKRIVAILDEVFTGLVTTTANTEKNLQNVRELFNVQLMQSFDKLGVSCKRMRLQDVSVEFGRGRSRHRPRNDPKLYGGPFPFIQTGDVRNCSHIITEHSQTYSTMGLAQSKLWPKGTICITIAANIAETGILGFDACFPDSVIGMVVDEGRTSSKYVEYLLQSMKAILQAKGKGSAQDNINLGTFENEQFPFPSLHKQQQVVEMLDSLREESRSLEEICRNKLVALSELRQSILQKAFSGELTAKPDRVLAEVGA